ncbi:hypothetical protein [Paenibacillus pini]|uniref:Uncharacterized protein n=1 Tax=Paenibacillus pini JCM 16418 TaxID=1236976 RepID=W7YQB6_9BACL|nr:hypothetical protein [Paenibacillus pini]GAF10727.1 hypothetical protein JCM16418_4946 [Paenibacillus pini JCM 16418]
MSNIEEYSLCYSGCEEPIKEGDRYVIEGNGDTHHAKCFDEWADEEFRYKFNDHAYRTK